MYACGHDVHIATWMGAARIMASSRNLWRGTLVMIDQPAEEIGGGSAAMVAEGLLTRFPRPDYVTPVHDDARYAAGIDCHHAGALLSNSNTVKIVIFSVAAMVPIRQPPWVPS